MMNFCIKFKLKINFVDFRLLSNFCKAEIHLLDERSSYRRNDGRSPSRRFTTKLTLQVLPCRWLRHLLTTIFLCNSPF